MIFYGPYAKRKEKEGMAQWRGAKVARILSRRPTCRTLNARKANSITRIAGTAISFPDRAASIPRSYRFPEYDLIRLAGRYSRLSVSVCGSTATRARYANTSRQFVAQRDRRDPRPTVVKNRIAINDSRGKRVKSPLGPFVKRDAERHRST